MNRELCKFLSGTVAGLAGMHAAYAVATSRGMIDEPVFLGKKWGVGYMWTEAVVYSAISLALGYYGWSSKYQEIHDPRASATGGQTSHDPGAGQDPRLSASR